MTKWADNEEQENDRFPKRIDDNNGRNSLMTIAAKARETSQNKAKSEGQTIKSRHSIALGMERNYPHKNNSKSSF